MLNVWTRLIVSLSQFSSKISRKSLKLERPWQGLSQLFTLKFWFLNFKKILSKTKYIRIIKPHRYNNIAVHNWSHGVGSVLSTRCHVRLVTASKLEWAAESRAGEKTLARAGTRCGPGHWGDTGSPNIGHRLTLDPRWGGKYTPRNDIFSRSPLVSPPSLRSSLNLASSTWRLLQKEFIKRTKNVQTKSKIFKAKD